MRFLLAFIFTSISCLAFAQQDTTVAFSNPGYNKDPLRSKLRKVIEKKDSLWQVSLYDKKDVLVEQISYADEKLEVRKGLYKFYENGELALQGNYDRGYKVGEWKSFYANKQLRIKSNYIWGNLFNNYESYWDNGQLKSQGKYQKNKRVGNWKLLYKNGNSALQELYDEEGKFVDGVYYNEEGKTVDKKFVITPPVFPGGIQAFYRYLGSEIRYPKNAVKNRVEGVVRVSFTVLKDGKIDDIEIMSSPNGELSAEALRVIKNSGDWVPALEIGEPVSMRFSLPVKFSLGK
jgi:TonB family protein